MATQETKDKLWQLDENTIAAMHQITSATGEAWKMAIEGGNIRRQLLHAADLARALEARIRSTITDLEID